MPVCSEGLKIWEYLVQMPFQSSINTLYEAMTTIHSHILIFLHESFFTVIEKFRCYENICIIYFVSIKREYCKEENSEGHNV